jgi:hypothetical protein
MRRALGPRNKRARKTSRVRGEQGGFGGCGTGPLAMMARRAASRAHGQSPLPLWGEAWFWSRVAAPDMSAIPKALQLGGRRHASKSATPTPGHLDRLTHLGEQRLFENASLCQAEPENVKSARRQRNERRRLRSGRRPRRWGALCAWQEALTPSAIVCAIQRCPGLDRGSPGSPFAW